MQARQPHTSTRKGLASYLFFWVESGSGELEYEGAWHELHAGDCVFLDCQRPYQHRTGDDLWQLHWVHFYGPNMAAIYKKYQERGGLPCFRAADLPADTRRCWTHCTRWRNPTRMCAICRSMKNSSRC